ncbi:hypothetical protein C0995_004812, partial [Termitomyces sp. Mi166
CLWNGVGIRMQKKCPPVEVLLITKCIKLVWAQKLSLSSKEGFKGKPTAAMPVSKPAPVKSAGKPAVKEGSVFKNPFLVRQFKLASTEESATEVAAGKVASAATQETLQSEEDTGNDKGSNNNEDEDEGSKDDDDDSGDDNDAAMDVDSGSLDAKILKTLHSEETWPMVPTKVMVTDDVVPAPVGLFTCSMLLFNCFPSQ